MMTLIQSVSTPPDMTTDHLHAVTAKIESELKNSQLNRHQDLTFHSHMYTQHQRLWLNPVNTNRHISVHNCTRSATTRSYNLRTIRTR
eukprot:840732-Amphidinium_carterae.4